MRPISKIKKRENFSLIKANRTFVVAALRRKKKTSNFSSKADLAHSLISNEAEEEAGKNENPYICSENLHL